MTPGKRRAFFRSLFHKWRWPTFFKCAAVVAALGVYAVGIYLLWGAVRKPPLVKWAAVDVALAVYAAGIYLLWGAVRKPLFLKWAAVVAALGLCAVGILLLWGVWDGTPVAAAFTRVGGATHVETALEASRFWLTPPRYVVKTQTYSSQLLLGAAQCAMAYDAPLLFTSPDRKRQRRVEAKINDWRKIETPKGLARPEVSIFHRHHDLWRPIETKLPKLITIRTPGDVTHCLRKRHLADISGLSTLEVPSPLIRLPHVPAQNTLAPVVVFAAAIQPGHSPDVAVGLALAAHMARANREKVSLVVVPHYLESDLELENKLQSQHKPVTGGVVLGQTPTVPEDTRALLRQLLTSRDRQGVLAQVQANLGSVGTLIAALLALVGAATATRIGGMIIIERRERTERERTERERTERERIIIPGPSEEEPISRPEPLTSIWTKLRGVITRRMTMKKSDWLINLGENQEVTVSLRSGRQVTGVIESQIPTNTRDATVFRIKKARSVSNDPASLSHVSQAKPEEKYVLVSVKDIEQIEINDSKSETAKDQPAVTTRP